MSGTTDPTATAKSTVSDWLQKLQKEVDNLLTLDVMTITGTLEIKLAGGANTTLNPSDLFTSLQAAVNADATKFKVVAMTHKEIDLDTIHFVAENLTDAEKALLTTHDAMVKTSEDGRLAFLKTLFSLATSLI